MVVAMRRSLGCTVAIAVALATAAVTTGCGARCADVAARKRALTERRDIAPGPHASVRVPLARANQLLAELIRDQPIRAPIEMPDLRPLPRLGRPLSALVRKVELRPAPAGRLQFAIELELADTTQPITTLTAIAEVTPELVRTATASELVAGFSPDNLVAVRPTLGPDASRGLADALRRWAPRTLGQLMPPEVIEPAAGKLAEYLTGKAYDVLRATLLHRLGELTRLRIRLPALPIARTAVTSSDDAITVDLTTDLPARRGLDRVHNVIHHDDDGEIIVQISQSTAAELANWSIAHGHLPQRYTRSLEPRADGEYRPWFDYVAADTARPVKIHIFQETGGCSYFQVGLRYDVAVAGDQLRVEVRDRYVEAADASAILEAGLWLKQLIQGSIDSSYRAAAHTRLTIGSRHLDAKVLGAAIAGDDLAFTLALAAAP
jgi:hypothetical protein